MDKNAEKQRYAKVPEPIKQEPIEDLGILAKALGHPARVTIIKVLIEKGTCIASSLAEELPLAQSTVSEHLRILRESGLVQGTVDGPKRCYCINQKTLDYLKFLINEL
ncbi:MAG: ArsR/SmtB family transcription factor [Oligoflexales bacterium]